MSTFEFIEYRCAGGLVSVTLNKPPLNVLDIPMMESLGAALAAAAGERDAKVVLLTGSGDKAFSAGVEVADHTPDRVERMVQVFGDVFRRLEEIQVPTVAALNGAALGGGCELAIACDMVIAAAHAKIGQPEIKLGVFPPVAVALLERLISPGKAWELVLGGEAVTATDALQCGLVNKVYAKEEFTTGVQTYLAQFSRHSAAVLALAKRALRAGRGRPFLDALARADEIYLRELMTTADAAEGLAAFLEKRQPRWRNK